MHIRNIVTRISKEEESFGCETEMQDLLDLLSTNKKEAETVLQNIAKDYADSLWENFFLQMTAFRHESQTSNALYRIMVDIDSVIPNVIKTAKAV